jgi:Uroporphyrinogen decarboxylase (URO-D)
MKETGKMNSTERVMAAVNFRKPDAVPYWDSTWPEFDTRWHKELNIDPCIAPFEYYGNDIITPVCPAEGFFFKEKGKLRDEGEWEIWNDGWGATVKRQAGTYLSEHIDRKLKEKRDFDKLRFDPVDLDDRYTEALLYLERERTSGRCIFSKIGGLYCRTQFMRGEVELLMDMVLDPGFCHAMFDRTMEHLTGMALEGLKRFGTNETGLFIYDDMASSKAPMFGPEQFEEYLLPRYKQLIAIVRTAGCKHVFFHSDGNIGPVIEMLLEAGFEGFNPLEPRCGMGLVGLREKYGERFTCFGGICATDILVRGDKKEIADHVLPLLKLGREGGIVLGTASISDDVDPNVYDWYRNFIKENS